MTDTPPPTRARGKSGRIVFALAALAALGGGGYAGWTFSPFHAVPETGAKTGTAEIALGEPVDAGIFPVPSRDGEGAIFRILLTPVGPVPPAAEMRNQVNAMLAVIGEMPLVHTPGLDVFAAQDAMEAMAKTEAPWIGAVEFTEPKAPEKAPEEPVAETDH